MIWDRKQIEKTLIKLNEKISKIETEPLLSKLKMDCFVLLDILKTLDISGYTEMSANIALGNLDFSRFYRDFQEQSLKSVLEHKKTLFELAKESEKIPYLYPRMLMKKRISEEKYLEMVRVFVAEFDNSHLHLYESILDGKLHFARNKHEVEGVKGRCYTFLTLEDTYIITDFRKSNVVETLPHELAHGIELSMLNDIRRNIGWHYSTFVECYPRLIELLFLDFYRESEYGEMFLLKKREIFDSLKISSEYYLKFISNMCGYDLAANKLVDEKGNRVSKKQIDFIIADSLAIYMFNLYKNDRGKFFEFLTEFHSYKGINDRSIWDMVSLTDLKLALCEESIKYNEEVKYTRSRRKTNTSHYL